MVNTRLVQSGSWAHTAANHYMSIGAGGYVIVGAQITNENFAKVIQRTAGTFTNLQVICTVRTGSTIISLLKSTVYGTAGATQGNTVTISGTGTFEDTGHTDTVSAADMWDYKFSNQATTDTLVALTFAPTTGTSHRLISFATAAAYGYGYVTANQDNYSTIGGQTTKTTEANAKTRVTTTCTLKNLFANINANTGTTGVTISTRVGGGAGAQSFTATPPTTGFLEDTSNIDSRSSGDDVNLRVLVGATSPGVNMAVMGTDFSTTNGISWNINGQGTALTLAKATTSYMGLSGSMGNTGQSDTPVQTIAKDAYTYSLLTADLYSNTNASNPSCTINFRKNASSTGVNQTIAWGATTAGIQSDTTHTDVVIATDTVNYQIITGTGSGSQSAALQWIQSCSALPTSTLYTPSIATEALGSVTETTKKYGLRKLTTETVSLTQPEGMVKRRQVPRTGADTVSLGADAIKKFGLKKRTEALGAITEVFSGSKIQHYTRTITEGTITISESLGVQHFVVAITEVLTALKIHIVSRSLSDTLTFGTDALKKLAVKKPSDTLTLTDSVKKLALHKYAEALGAVSDVLVEKTKHIRALAEALGSITDALQRKALHKRGVTEALGVVTEALVKKAMHPRTLVTEALGAIVDSAKKLAVHKAAEALTVTDSAKKIAKKAIIVEAMGAVADALTEKAKHFITLATETLGAIVDVLEASKTIGTQLKQRFVSETVTLSDAIVEKALHLRAITEALSVSESLAKKAVHFRAAAEALGAIADSLVERALHLRTISDTSTLSDSLARKASFFRAIAESLLVTESLAKKASHFRAITVEALGTVSESIKRKMSRVVVTEALGSITESIKRGRVVRALTEALGTITDAIVLSKAGLNVRSIAETVLLSEGLAKQAKHFRTLTTEALDAITDSLKKRAVKSLSQPLGAIADVLGRAAAHKRGISEALGIVVESTKKKASLRIAQSVTVGTETLLKKAAKRATETLGAITDVLGRVASFKRAVSDALGAISESPLKKKAIKPLAQLVSVVGEALAKKASRRLSELAISVTDVVNATKGGAQQLYSRAITESTIAISEVLHWVLTSQQVLDELKKKVSKHVGEPALLLTDSIVRFTKIRSFTLLEPLLSISDTILRGLLLLSALEVLSVADVLKKAGFKRRSEPAIPFSEVTVKVKRAYRASSEPSISISDVLKKRAAKLLSQPLLLTETVRKYASRHVIAEVLVVSETLSKAARHRLQEVAITIGDVTRKLSRKALADLLVITESLKKKAFKKLVEALSVSMTELLARSRKQFQVFTDLLTVSETLKRPKIVRVFSEVLIELESLLKKSGLLPKQLSETVPFPTETIARRRRQFRFISDLVGSITDTLGLAHRFVINISDVVGGVPGFARKLRHHFGGKRPMYETPDN